MAKLTSHVGPQGVMEIFWVPAAEAGRLDGIQQEIDALNFMRESRIDELIRQAGPESLAGDAGLEAMDEDLEELEAAWQAVHDELKEKYGNMSRAEVEMLEFAREGNLR